MNKEKKTFPQGYFILMGTLLGLPIGIAFSLAIGNFAFVGTGMAIGLPIGIALEEKYKKEGRIRKDQPGQKETKKKVLFLIVGITLALVILTISYLKFK
ncbi:MAG: hypothetical protein HWE15_01690 [Algoriphagus sp.]|uniref:hypothetical protein n=1 Tax=Algoriphagus sp. TaxID=1872435 RepID=UPI0017A6B975|nr:hypothetical protein [Algoriphagus sp.]NVJ84983.1 hypothetical protein [Algoriphagus sp.]